MEKKTKEEVLKYVHCKRRYTLYTDVEGRPNVKLSHDIKEIGHWYKGPQSLCDKPLVNYDNNFHALGRRVKSQS